MKTLLILGAGTAGTMIAHKMAARLDNREWKIVMVDKDENHYYQPGFLFLPFGMNKPSDVVKPKRRYIPRNVEFVLAQIESLEPQENRVTLSGSRLLHYDYLIITTGTDIHPEETEGMKDGAWRKNIFDFYTFDGAVALTDFMKNWQGGRMVVNIAELPFKCPVAPLEFVMLADDYFKRRGIRNKVEIVFSTPLSGAFTKPRASEAFGNMLSKRGIHVEADFAIAEVDTSKNAILSYDEREIPYDLLVTIPVNMGEEFIARAGIGDDLNFVLTDKHTLQSVKYPNIWAMGDTTNIPASKAGSVAHYQLHTMEKNILAHMQGKELPDKFDGHSQCFIESGAG